MGAKQLAACSFGWFVSLLVRKEVLLAGLCERKILFRLEIYDRLRQATAKRTGYITAESGNTFYIKVVEIFASFSERYGMQSDDHQTGRYDRFTALLFLHIARNFQIVYITFVLVTYHLFVNLLIILKHHMDHG